MTTGIQLTPEQEQLRDETKTLLNYILANIENDTSEEFINKYEEMAQKAHQLHMSLKESGNNPKHHRYMYENREAPPDDVEFYRHVHPVEDLIAFTLDPHANDDPEDQTIDHEFTFKVFSRRWGHYDTYHIQRTATGWNIGFRTTARGPCDKDGNPDLYKTLDHDSINYPNALPGYLEWLWEQGAEQGLSHEVVQLALDQLAEWVSLCEKNTPGGIFRGWK